MSRVAVSTNGGLITPLWELWAAGTDGLRTLSAEGKWIRTLGSAILIKLRETGLSETDQRTTEHGVGRIPAYPALSARPPVDSNNVTSGSAEVDPIPRAPLPQSHFLGVVQKIVPPFEGAPPHQQILKSAVSASSAEDAANFVVVVR